MRPKRPRILRRARVIQRRLGFWLDRNANEWHRQIPSWGVSLLFHTTFLLMLALWLYVQAGSRRNDIEGRFAAQLTEDLTSLGASDHAGDPFTRLKTDEPPSLSLVPSKPDETAISQPEIPNIARFAPELAGPETPEPKDSPQNSKALAATLTRRLAPELSSRALGTVVTRVHVEDMSAPFSGRDEAIRAKLVRREGGTVHSEKAVEMALDWLSRHQKPDGGWALNFQSVCQGGGCPPGICLESETAATGLALLPMLGAGHIHTKKTHFQREVRQGLAWLIGHQKADGDLYYGDGGMPHMYSHAIGTMALCEAYGLSNDPQLRAHAQKAIDFIAQSQSPDDGGWRYAPGQAGDTSVFGWQMFALRSARLSGLRVPASVLKGCRKYLDGATADTKKITYSYMPGRGVSPVMTAEGLLTRQYLGWPRDFPALVKGAAMVAHNLEDNKERNIYYWYYATQLLHNMQNKDWKRWNVRVRDGLVAMQTTGAGCDRGSWDPNSPQPDTWARTDNRHGAGRLYLTALSTLTLEVYYRYLPLYAPTDGDTLKLDGDKADADKPDVAGP
jgi:Squalene-hopene cyclase C-terminal domain/Prenyltransferase and squalene oxidase repeat